MKNTFLSGLVVLLLTSTNVNCETLNLQKPSIKPAKPSQIASGLTCWILDSQKAMLGSATFYFDNDQSFIYNSFSTQKMSDELYGTVRRDDVSSPFEFSITSIKEGKRTKCHAEVFITPTQFDSENPLEFPHIKLNTNCDEGDSAQEVYTLDCMNAGC